MDLQRQPYDNGVSMTLMYEAVQARICELISCSVRSLNLSCCHETKISSDMTAFFATLSDLPIFLYSSVT